MGVVLACATCGTEPRLNAKFCDECGSAITASPRIAEYKLVTVLADAPADDGLVIRDIWLLRTRALLARAHADDAAYREYRDRYRDKARTFGYEGHIDWAEAMT